MSQNNNDKKKKFNVTIIISFIMVALIIAGIFVFMKFGKKEEDKNFAYTQLLSSINDGTVEKIEMTEGSDTAKVKLINDDVEKVVLIPSVDSFIDLVQEKSNEGMKINLIQKERNVVMSGLRTLLSFLPTFILVVLVIMIFKMQGLGEKGKVYDSETQKTKIKFDDVAGLDEEKQEMIEILELEKH